MADWLTNIGGDVFFDGGFTYPSLSKEVQQSIVQYVSDEFTSAPSAPMVYSIECTKIFHLTS